MQEGRRPGALQCTPAERNVLTFLPEYLHLMTGAMLKKPRGLHGAQGTGPGGGCPPWHKCALLSRRMFVIPRMLPHVGI